MTFNLKVGKSIYQVDYDHSNGKFTESEKIDSSDNLIVCGLHSLYNKNESLYDVKIFMDPQDELKKEWKIERDISQRGHTRDKIEKQIEDRKEDYKKFILPQKDRSDVIVNFLKEVDKIELNIYIRKNFRIDNILENFILNKIPFEISSNKNFHIVRFKDYLPVNPWKYKNVPNYGNFYDYIVFIILKLTRKK
jgi:uridine kinase